MNYFSFFIISFFLSSCLTHQKNIKKANSHHQIAVGLISECDKPRALSHLRKAVRFNPRDFLIRHTLATIYYSMNQYDKALGEYKRILKRNPGFTEARVNMARIYVDLNQPERSLKEIKLAEKDMTYTNYLKIVSQKALAYYKKGDYHNSKRWLREALSLPKGKNCFVYLHLGKTELALGYLQNSEQFLKKALRACEKETPLCGKPSHEEHLILGQLYIKKGDKKRARYHLNLFLKKEERETEQEKAKKLLQTISSKKDS